MYNAWSRGTAVDVSRLGEKEEVRRYSGYSGYSGCNGSRGRSGYTGYVDSARRLRCAIGAGSCRGGSRSSSRRSSSNKEVAAAVVAVIAAAGDVPLPTAPARGYHGYRGSGDTPPPRFLNMPLRQAVLPLTHATSRLRKR